jgi:hypothetical protein
MVPQVPGPLRSPQVFRDHASKAQEADSGCEDHNTEMPHFLTARYTPYGIETITPRIISGIIMDPSYKITTVVVQLGYAAECPCLFAPEQVVRPRWPLGQLFGSLQGHRFDEAGFDLLVLHPGTSLLQRPPCREIPLFTTRCRTRLAGMRSSRMSTEDRRPTVVTLLSVLICE